jgi:hypothetical protein
MGQPEMKRLRFPGQRVYKPPACYENYEKSPVKAFPSRGFGFPAEQSQFFLIIFVTIQSPAGKTPAASLP